MKRFWVSLLLLLPLWTLSAAAQDGEPVTRGEFVILVWESQGGVPFDKTAHPFSDLTGRDEIAQAAAWGWELGIVRGVGDGLFAPDRPITREECAALLRRSDSRLGRDVFLPDGPSLCNDNEGISPWAADDLYWACVTGRMDWLDGRLAPQAPVTRQEAEGYWP